MNANNNTQPLISVLMPMFNAELYVKEAVQSIQRQTYRHWELIIVDDCSTDGSVRIVRQIAKTDPRIKLRFNPKNGGIGATMNRALHFAKGKYLARMDADDVAFPTRFEKQIEFLTRHPDVGVVGSYMLEINEHNDIIAARHVPLEHNEIARNMINTQTIQNSTNMINRRLIPVHQLRYDVRYSPVDDLDFWFRQLNYVKYANIPEYLMGYRKHSNNASLKNIKRTFSLTNHVRLKALTKYGYSTGAWQLLIHFVQMAVVFTIPNRMLYGLFKIWKGDAVQKTHLVMTEETITNRTPLHLKPIPAYIAEPYMHPAVIRIYKSFRREYHRIAKLLHRRASHRARQLQKALMP